MYRLGTYHFAEVEKGVLYRDGNRGLREFKNALHKGSVRTVIMLNDDQEVQKEPFNSELELLKDRGAKHRIIERRRTQSNQRVFVRSFEALDIRLRNPQRE